MHELEKHIGSRLWPKFRGTGKKMFIMVTSWAYDSTWSTATLMDNIRSSSYNPKSTRRAIKPLMTDFYIECVYDEK